MKFAGVLLAVGLSLASGTALADEVLRIKPSGDVKALDPLLGSDSMARNYGYMVYDTLFAVDASLTIKPQMVDTWSKSEDGKTYTFTLRDGLKFSDGSPVTSADVIASLKRWSANDSLGQQMTQKGAAWSEVDARTFTLTLSEPWGFVLEALGKPGAPVPFIMPARVASVTPPNEAVKDYTGSGPFVFLANEWVPGAKLAFAKNPHYVPRKEPASGLAGGKIAKMDRVEWLIIPDQQTALDALRKGEIDIDEDLAADLIPLAEDSEGVDVAKQDEIGVAQQIRINTVQPPFDNPLVRKALLTAVNGEDFLAAVITDPSQGVACQSFYSCGSPYATPEGYPKPDIEKARAIVAESGYDGTPAVLLDATENANIHAFVTVADQLLRDIGIKTRVDAMDWATVTSRRQSKEPVDKGGWSIFISGPGGLDYLEPVGHLGLRSNCEKAWFGWPCDAEIEAMRTEFANLSDEQARKTLAEKIQLRAIETVPYVPIGTQYQIRAHRDNLAGILTPPAPVYWNIERK
ncbi:ABC transporter substrate-binding protein [Rhizobium alarense]|uniref:ABC transporter substrate-binding protein n=1 Tax=Rhizobium alarense TaxID=2846851 RepID=UPI0038B42737